MRIPLTLVRSTSDSEIRLKDVYYWSFHRIRRIVRDSIYFSRSFFCALWWLENADWHHPVSIQKDLMNHFIHYLKDVVWPYFSKPTDWLLTATFVAMPYLLAVVLLASFGDLMWSVFNHRASFKFRWRI